MQLTFLKGKKEKKNTQTLANSHESQVRAFIYQMRSYFCWQICVFPCVPKPLPFEPNEVEVANQEHRIKSIERYNQFGTGIDRKDRKTTKEQVTFTKAGHCRVGQRWSQIWLNSLTGQTKRETQSISQFNIFVRHEKM